MRRLLLALPLLAPAALAQPRDMLTIGITQYPGTFHPSIEAMMAKSYILGFTRRNLTVRDPDWKLVCLACETLPSFENGGAVRETTPDGKEGVAVTYRLKEGLRWGDGTPVTADDITFAWQAGRDPSSGIGPAELYRSLWKITVVDPRTVTLHSDKLTFEYNSAGDLNPLPAHLEREVWQADPRAYRTRTRYDTDTTNPGLWNGPYRVVAKDTGASVTLARNDAWTGPRPVFDRIVVRTVESTPALEANLLAGQVDMIAGELGLPLDQALALEKRAGGRFRFAYKSGLTYEHIDLNLDHPTLSDRRVRQALVMAVDRDAIGQRLFAGRQPVADTAVNPLDSVYDRQVRRWPYDPARAAALLDEAGWRKGPDGIRAKDGTRLSLELMTTAGNRVRELVQQVLQGAWRQAGIEIRIRNEPPRVFFGETVSRRRFQMAMFAWVSSPENVPRTTLHSEEIPTEARNWSGQNYPGFRSAEMDKLLEELPVTLDLEARKPLWARLQAIYAEELPTIPLFFRADAHIWPRWLHGVRPTGHMYPSTLWVEEWRVAP